jgi:hypothetical protein
VLAASCSRGAGPVIELDDDAYAPRFDAARFVDVVDNPFLPLPAGARWVYEGGDERTEVVVTDRRRDVAGVSAVVVRDTVRVDGEITEDTYDWFAQDRDGNVWYLGEDTTEYEHGTAVSTEGSWEAGVDGARPGIVMPARPRAGMAYRQEYLKGEAEDLAEIVRVGAFEVVTREWNPLEPKVVEEKHYTRGVGLEVEVTTRGGRGRTQLVEFAGG